VCATIPGLVNSYFWGGRGAVLVFELRALHLLGKCFTLEPCSQHFSLQFVSQVGSRFFQSLAETRVIGL
jgi:hypothetical protein